MVMGKWTPLDCDNCGHPSCDLREAGEPSIYHWDYWRASYQGVPPTCDLRLVKWVERRNQCLDALRGFQV